MQLPTNETEATTVIKNLEYFVEQYVMLSDPYHYGPLEFPINK